MKKIILVLGLVISQLSFSQIEKEVGDFNKVTSFDKIDVTLVASNENKVLVTGTNSDKVEIVNKNGELKIRLPLTRLLDGDNIEATVYYKNIDAVEANEGSRISSNDVFKATSFDIIAKEGAEIKVDVDVSSITIKSSSGAKVTVSGTAKSQNSVSNSGGLLYASKLKTTTTSITVNAGGNAEVNATDVVDAKVRAGGKIIVFGKPKQINEKTFAGGKIEQAK
jgi:hypothetical protein